MLYIMNQWYNQCLLQKVDTHIWYVDHMTLQDQHILLMNLFMLLRQAFRRNMYGWDRVHIPCIRELITQTQTQTQTTNWSTSSGLRFGYSLIHNKSIVSKYAWLR
jgi:hypothetical protein